MSSPEPIDESTILELVPDYEQDLSAVGENRQAVDPDPRSWQEVHELSDEEAKALQ
jgi:hypothetical protein